MSTKNTKKKIINAVVIVEGKTDSCKLKQIFDVQTIETNGLRLNDKKLNEIKEISKKRKIILFLDPDGPGEKIRKKIIDNVPNTYNCFISKKDVLSSKKIGVAEASCESIIKAFENVSQFNVKNESIIWNEYIDLELTSKAKRLFLCNKLKISYCNHKQLFKRLNMLNLRFDEVKSILNNFN